MNKLRLQLACLTFVFLTMGLAAQTAQAGTCVPSAGVYDGSGGLHGGPWTLARSPYIINETFVGVPDGKTLTIEVGVVVLIRNSSIEVEGTLVARGVTFTGLGEFNRNTCSGQERPVPGSWQGLLFRDPDPGSILENCRITYGGGSYAITISSPSIAIQNKNLTISNCFIAYSSGSGIRLANGASPIISGTTIQGHARNGMRADGVGSDAIVAGCAFIGNGLLAPVQQPGLGYPLVAFADNVKNFSNLFISGNATDAIWVWGENIFTSTWQDHGVPYHVAPNLASDPVGVRDGQTLTLEPGVDIRFGPSRGLSVLGTLVADGDSCRHITFDKIDTSATAQRWSAISLTGSDPGTILDYCDISNGGFNSQPSLSLNGVGNDVVISNCRITQSLGAGIGILSTNATSSPLIFNNLIGNNALQGIRISSGPGSVAVLRYNLITRNNEGIRIATSNGTVDLGTADSLGQLGHNAFVNNAGFELYNLSSAAISAIGNFWVDTDIAVIDSVHIFDNDERAASGSVILNPVDLTNQSRSPQVVLCPPSCAALSITITNPTSSSNFQTTSSYLTLGGTAGDDRGVSGITWTNSTTGASGTAILGPSRRNVTWSAPNILLASGQNFITVTATDGDGCSASDQIIVTLTDAMGCWEFDSFDNLSLGSLNGQNGWVTVPGRPSVSVVANPAGPGQVVQMDAGPNQVAIMEKDVPDQATGLHTLELLVLAVPSDTSMAKIEVKTTGNPNWDKKFQLYFGTSMRLNYGPTQPQAIIFLTRTESQRWYHVRAVIDLGTNLVDLFLDGVQVLNDIAVGPGAITHLSVSAWDYPGYVLFDDIRGCNVLTTSVNSKSANSMNEARVITDYRLEQNYPNPFNPGTLIKYEIPQAGQVVVKVYNSIGQEVRTLVNEQKPMGSYQISWDGRDERGRAVPSGLYFCRLQAGDFVQTRKMTLMK